MNSKHLCSLFGGNARLYVIILQEALVQGVTKRKLLSSSPIERKGSTDMSNLLHRPLSALWLRPVHRDTLTLIREDAPGSRHAKKLNRNKKAFTAGGD
ncbi:hypothetical protein D623_10000435 [Myotis brandtii]|uniref:Uncharacterized protein n=1 Tax=Myotis brandtii TaxID=109478 RepID=S7NS19_MYOBR|nr:hypothetical protein D623_10012473 [Myotis brandtii]EPQ20705.1 hypothetical protein D623_10000435 [Myotis brandtii]